MINIIYEDNHLLVVEKPVNIPVQADDSNDLDFLTMLKDYIKNKYNKSGNVYLGLVHRLDRPVGGIMVFAKTSKAASRLSEQVRTRKFKKEYYAVVKGKAKDRDHLVDNLIKDGKTNISRISENGKEAILDYELVSYINNLSLVKIDLKTGRSHQIRVQFSSRDLPLYGDQKYNNDSKVGEQLALFAKKICFYHPISNELLNFEINLPSRYPFNLFKDQQ